MDKTLPPSGSDTKSRLRWRWRSATGVQPAPRLGGSRQGEGFPLRLLSFLPVLAYRNLDPILNEMIFLPAALVCLIQMAFGSNAPPIYQESSARDEEVLRYRIRRLDVGEKNGWTFLTGAMTSQPDASAESKAALKAALRAEPFTPADLEKLAVLSDSARTILNSTLEKPYWQSLWDPEIEGKSATGFSALPKAVGPIVANLLMESHQDDPQGFLTDLQLLLKVTDVSRDCSISLEEWMVAAGLHQNLNRLVIQRLRGTRLPREALWSLAGILENSKQSMTGIRESLRHSFVKDLAEIKFRIPPLEIEAKISGDSAGSSISRSWLKFICWLTFSPSGTHSFFNQFAAGIVSRCDEPLEPSGHPAFAGIRAYRKPETTAEALQFNSLGRMLTITVLGAYEKLLKNTAINLTGREAILAAVALHRWQNDHDSELPDTLEQLVPEYLSKVPMDLADGKPLRYDREKRLIYSIGTDLIDNIPPVPEHPSLYSKDGEMVLLLP